MSFFDKHNFFSSNQFGFRSNMSTTDPLSKTSKFIHNNLDKKFNVLGIFLNFKKAFNSVNYNLLLKKLEYSGIRDHALNLIKSFISGRPQQVRINGLISDAKTNCFSVPQGTLLGPVL